MFEKLVHDARFDWVDINHAELASAENVAIQPGQVQVVHTGLYAIEPLILSLQKRVGKLSMCILLTTAITAEQEVKVAILNRGTEAVTLSPGERFLVACQLAVKECVDTDC